MYFVNSAFYAFSCIRCIYANSNSIYFASNQAFKAIQQKGLLKTKVMSNATICHTELNIVWLIDG
ncbi:hypothetical protein D3C73_758440 [compost metagenome]